MKCSNFFPYGVKLLQMIKREDLQIVGLTAKEILLTLFDATVIPFFEASSMYRKPARKYLNERENEKYDLRQKIYYLKKRGYINSFSQGKEKYLELTPKGLNHVKKMVAYDIKIEKPDKWDQKWRIVMFDISEKKHDERNIFREALLKAGFIQFQKSVFVYPFECTNEISDLSYRLGVSDNVVIMISEIFQGEETIIEEFIDSGIISREDLD